jgi:hypothetical protein
MRSLHICALVVVRAACHHGEELFLSASEFSDIDSFIKVAYSIISEHEGIEVINYSRDGSFRA